MIIDLRSDTVTRPTKAMRHAMADAVVGDDVYGEDPTINRLEETVAALLGKKAALFVPSGTMGNQIAVHCHTRPGDEVILESQAHIYNFEMGAMAALSGALPRLVQSPFGLPDPDDIERAIQPPAGYRSRTTLLALENTHNLQGGRILPQKGVEEVLAVANRYGLALHLDGARLWHVNIETGIPLPDLTRGFDSVMVCLSKGLAAPVGSLLCGSENFIADARRFRKILGGGMRQAGILAAAGLEALKMRDRLAEDHDNARRLARGIALLPGMEIDPDAVETNILFFRLTHPMGSDMFAVNTREKGLLLSRLGDRFRAVTHHGISTGEIDRALEILANTLDRR